MAKKNNGYNAKDIQSLSAHNHLLKRLSLTFGRETGDTENPFSSQKSVAIREIIDNAIDEAKDGYGDYVSVSYFKDGSFEVKDTGRGLPVDIGVDSEGRKVSGVYLTMGVIQSGGKFSTDSKRFSSGLNGVGGSSTNHTSKRVDVTVYRNKKEYHLSFKDGTPGFFDLPDDPESNFTELEDYTYLEELKDSRSADEKKKHPTGTTIRVWLRDSVFQSNYPVDTLDLTERLKGTAFLIPGITIDVHDEINVIKDEAAGTEEPRNDRFHFEGGIPELVQVNINKPMIGDIFHFTTNTSFLEKNVPVLNGDVVTNEDVTREVEIDVAFAWEADYEYFNESYVNTIRTRLGGVHEDAFEKALVNAFGERFNSLQGLMKKSDPKLTFEDFCEGLIVVLSVNVSEPTFTSQTKEELSGKLLQKAITNKLTEVFGDFAQSPKNNSIMKTVGEKIVVAARNRQAIREQQALNRKKNQIEGSGDMPEKLVDCEITGEDFSELYIIEGDSALSALKGARLGKFQALLPLKGKIISAYKHSPAKVLASQEVQNMIKAMGAGSGNTFDLEKCRYGRVFISTDADPDGGDIAALTLAFLWVYMKPLIMAGRVYKLVTPLFVVTEKPGTKNEIRHYCLDDDEMRVLTQELKEAKRKHVVQRLKGLGEGGVRVMSETAMNPLTRTIERVVVKNEAESEKMLDLIFGPDAQARKDWLVANPIDEFSVIE